MRSVVDIEKLATKVPFFEHPKVTFFSAGFGNYNYVVQEKGKKYILRIKKSSETQLLDSLEKEYAFLKYFRTQGIEFCPEVFFYDREDNFLVESFLEGREVAQKEFSSEQINTFAKQLQQLFVVDVAGFTSFAAENNCKTFVYVSPLESLDIYGYKRFKKAKEDGLDNETCLWIETHLAENHNYLETVLEKSITRGFAWGDIQSRVIIGPDEGMYFYDFEHANIADSFGLGYIKIHGSFSEEQFNYLIERCAFYFGRSATELHNETLSEERVIRVNDVIWEARKWTETDDSKYEAKMKERIKLVEELD